MEIMSHPWLYDYRLSLQVVETWNCNSTTSYILAYLSCITVVVSSLIIIIINCRKDKAKVELAKLKVQCTWKMRTQAKSNLHAYTIHKHRYKTQDAFIPILICLNPVDHRPDTKTKNIELSFQWQYYFCTTAFSCWLSWCYMICKFYSEI